MERKLLDHVRSKRSKNIKLQFKLLGRQKRFLRRKRTLRKIKFKKVAEDFVSRLNVAKYESDDDCLGDSEESDNDECDENKFQINYTRDSLKLCSKTRLSLAENQLDNNQKGQLTCLTCLKQFSNIQNLRRHLRLHLKRDSNIAEIDSAGEKEDDSKKFQCDFCPEKFDNKSAFQVHEKLHSSQELICFVCEKKYLDRYSLRYHLRTHGIGLQIRCELCGKNFTKQSRLQAHIDSIHKNIRNFKCPHCDKAFKTKIHLDNHLLQHTGEKPFHCNQCGENFRHKLSLISHQRIHSDSRPYVCDKCGRAFRDNSTLKAHTRVHSGDKPYKCNLCEKSFTQRAGLNYHKIVHTGVKPYKCSHCDYATAKKASLLSHNKSVHKYIQSEMKSKTMSVECSEKSSSSVGSIPPLPSPPSQQGDAMYSGPHHSQTQNKYEEPLSNSLPSFNILKSYDSSSLQDAIVVAHNSQSHRGTGPGHNEERYSGYESHSDPSLSPPLTPPMSAEFQRNTSEGGQESLETYSYNHNHHANHTFVPPIPLPLNYSTYRNSDCEDSRFQSFYGSQTQFSYNKREMFAATVRETNESNERVKNNPPTSETFYTRDQVNHFLNSYSENKLF